VIGALEIGGTHVAAARVDPTSAELDPSSRLRLALPLNGGRDELLERILEAARAVAGDGIERLGIAVPGPFDYERGISEVRHKLAALHGVDLRRALAGALGLPADAFVFLNDADAFLLGEWWAGAARGRRRAAGITLGTGLGSAFLVDGRIVRSGPGVFPGGEAHVVEFRGRPVEETISRGGLLARYGASDEALDVKEIAGRARDGELRARETLADFGSALGDFLGPWLREFEPECVVVGGSIARAWELFAPALEHALAPLSATAAENLDDAPLLGAALHAG
jgi:predicted NBD/HSP70 family sugar kinase